jgi:hypothetical protein
MRFSTIIFSAVTVLLVSAQSATDASSTIAPAVSGTAVASAAETSEAACLAACEQYLAIIQCNANRLKVTRTT